MHIPGLKLDLHIWPTFARAQTLLTLLARGVRKAVTAACLEPFCRTLIALVSYTSDCLQLAVPTGQSCQ
jgi:hypothetical protein